MTPEMKELLKTLEETNQALYTARCLLRVKEAGLLKELHTAQENARAVIAKYK